MSAEAVDVRESPTVADFTVRRAATTRWSDNDMYGHLNNAVYYQLFDAAINGWIIEHSGLDPVAAPSVGVVAESGCRYFEQVQFPQALEVGIRVARLGRTSVTYDLGLFPAGLPETAAVAARGRWVHVYVDRDTRRPVPIPDELRRLFESATG
ncbi:MULTISPECIES: acyl-CoA thioesterase [Rhodococcus]|uniref:acyl-CoA thioesterase n=1 Tax=Rhodococcus TaxID=1827 RepID=UPI00077A62A7|nr:MULTISPECIES: thioesterase family protein [Rhodococcus]KXX56700.1 4-hydroxybenzoyl-CoA thioesterase [Rhodococcus sp. LB1]QSE86155.1 acyl-CoA thioesterase [Rhodococcus koreensis]